MNLDVEDPPVATRAGIWVYEDGGIVDASKRASRELFMCSSLRTNPNGKPGKPQNYRFKSRLNAYKYSDKTPIPDGLGDDIPTEEDREVIFKARITAFNEGRWGYSWNCLQFAEMIRKGMSSREAKRLLVPGRSKISRVEPSPLEKRIDDWREGTTTEKRLHEEKEEEEEESGDWDMLSSYDSEDGHRKKRQRI
ncbi:hypothetical protein BDP27DRAFT_1332632 [Rhodocollybia butyracea]|uniref:Uncharacterized protein n=1 Tax=Rhodocollybia butyracea TaxID=206335 RepID=A0A9P5PJI9_9AGAR|nr:hypothetical protein BDP27DRAFT_1332632 [Rhodocollybia butyracea]